MIFSENRLPLLLIMLILVEHELFGKPASTFPDHAQALFGNLEGDQR
jgi:hypothetical protein